MPGQCPAWGAGGELGEDTPLPRRQLGSSCVGQGALRETQPLVQPPSLLLCPPFLTCRLLPPLPWFQVLSEDTSPGKVAPPGLAPVVLA